jgi:PKD repeat protein
VHGGIECVNYPWDSWVSSQKIHADDDWWQFVSHQYADTARLYSPSNYMNPSGSSFFNGVTNGGDWYVALGSRQDYLTAFTNSREFTLEISNTKTPAASTLPNYWNYNYRSFLNYMQQSLYGLRGIVTDSCSGQPVEAQVFITGHDVDNSHVYSMLPVGNYHRPLFSGTYAVTFSAPGYASKSFSNVLISNNNTTILNVALAPQAPLAIVTASPGTSCTGEIDFEAQIQNGDTWAWHFGDGTSASTSTTTHVYSQSGVYYPYLAITNCTGTQNIFVPDSIIIDLPAAPVAQNMSRCGPGSLTLTASAQGTINWFNSMSTQVPLDTGNSFTTPVLSQSATYYVESHQSQNAFTGALNPAGGQNYNSNFSHYLVFDCFKPVTLLSVDVYASIAGNRTIYLRNSSSQVIDSVVVNIPANGSRVTLNLDIPIGTNLQLAGPVYPNLYRTQSSSLSYPYTIPGYISIKNSSATTNPTGYYYFFYDWEVKLEECVSARIPVNATIDVMPVAAFSQLVNNLDVSFTSTSLGAATYLWDFGDGQTSTLQNPVHTYGSYGIFDVQLTVTNTCGSDVFNYQLNLNTLPPVANFEADDTTVSEGIYVNFSDLTLNNPNSWQWVFEGGTPAASTIQNPVVQYNVAGTYFVKLTVINAFGTDSLTKSGYITVFPGTLAPTADFTANQTVIDAGDSVQFTDISLYTPTSWLWNLEGGTPSSSTVQNPSITYNTPGTYFVSLIATNAFGTDYEVKYDFIQVNPSGIEDVNSVRMLSVYPNPCASYLYVLLPAGIYGYTLQICDVSGKTQVLKQQAEQQGNILQLNVASLAQGMYFIDITNGFQTYRARFVK